VRIENGSGERESGCLVGTATPPAAVGEASAACSEGSEDEGDECGDDKPDCPRPVCASTRSVARVDVMMDSLKIDKVDNERNERDDSRQASNERGEQEADAVGHGCCQEREEGYGGGDGMEDEGAGEVVDGGGGGVCKVDVVHLRYDAGHVVADRTARALITSVLKQTVAPVAEGEGGGTMASADGDLEERKLVPDGRGEGDEEEEKGCYAQEEGADVELTSSHW